MTATDLLPVMEGSRVKAAAALSLITDHRALPVQRLWWVAGLMGGQVHARKDRGTLLQWMEVKGRPSLARLAWNGRGWVVWNGRRKGRLT